MNTLHRIYDPQDWERELLALQPTTPNQALVITPPPMTEPPLIGEPEQAGAQPSVKKRMVANVVAAVLVVAAGVALYLTFRDNPQSSAPQATTTQNFNAVAGNNKGAGTAVAVSSGSIQVYIVGAVKFPGIYTLDANARVYQLLRAAGGPQPGANLVAINLAAPLKDGEEIYIPKVGEKMPLNVGGSAAGTTGATTGTTGTTTDGQPVNINTASTDEMRQQLHVSARTAQAIADYRVQHGPYTSVDQLANVVSKAIFNRIKGMVTI